MRFAMSKSDFGEGGALQRVNKKVASLGPGSDSGFCRNLAVFVPVDEH